jgi:predicted nucleic acid-binding protein
MSARVLLDTNIIITGYRRVASTEGQVLQALRGRAGTTLLLSLPLEDQIRRVGRRLGGKDWAGLILNRFWRDFSVEYITLPERPLTVAQAVAPDIPREDLLIFLTAATGRATLFISGNREFLRKAATQQQLFVCLTPAEYLAKITGN